MRTSSRLAVLGLSIIATSGLVAGAAGAGAAEVGAGTSTYGAQANAEALMISVAGTQLTGSKATANLAQDPKSAAEATMILTPAFAPDPLTASADAVNTSDVQNPETCTGQDLEAIPGIARLEITCPEVAAVVDGGLPSAHALGAQLVLEPSVSGVLDTLGLQDTVTGATDQVFEDVLNPLVEALTGNPIGDLAGDTVSTVQDVLSDTLTLQSTARVVVAPALADVTSTSELVTATAQSQGIRVELLPVAAAGATNGLLPDDLLPGEPLVTITVGYAKAVSTYNRITQAKTESHDAGLVKIEFGSTALTDALGLSAEPITVDAGVSQCILADTPLETCVTVATAGVDADGNPYATSSSIELFKGVNGGVVLGTGGVTSGSAGALAAALPAVSPDLPRTGANPVLPMLGVTFLGLAVLVRKTLFARA